MCRILDMIDKIYFLYPLNLETKDDKTDYKTVIEKLLNIGGIPRERESCENIDKVCTEPLDSQSLLIRKTKGEPSSTSQCTGVSPLRHEQIHVDITNQPFSTTCKRWLVKETQFVSS